MTLFLLTFFLIYGSGHFYLFTKVKGAYSLSRRTTLWLSLWLLLMTTGPLLARWLTRLPHDGPARLTATVAYGWMGLLFYFIVIGLLLDALLLAVQLLVPKRWHATHRHRLFRHGVLVTILASLAVVGYGFTEARAIRLQRVVLTTAKLPPGMTRLKIAQLSDLHLGLLVGPERLRAVIETVQQAGPDIIVATGDLLDGQGDNLMELAALLRQIPAAQGKFAILGNHEFYAGPTHSQTFLERAGFVVLRNEARTVAGGVIIAGVDDRRGATWPMAATGGEEKLLATLAEQGRFVLLLKHRPQVAVGSLGHFDLQLSGHGHDGQLFPFGLLVRWLYPVPAGVLHPLARGYLYVSRGTGTWGPPIRVLAPPEVTLIELVAPPGAG